MKNYFDYAATTPCSDEVVKAMEPFWQDNFGNSNSRNHKFGWDAENALEIARKQIADSINAKADEIIFTSGATESNNLAIKGLITLSSKKKIISIATEHKCVIETLRYLRNNQIEVIFLPVNNEGLIDLNLFEQHLPGTALVTIAFVNNETGVIQDMEAISTMCRKAGVYLHTDAAQALGKIAIDARKFDLISLSGHKIYGPKGIGALFVSKNPRIRLSALFSGGGQERGMRSGTQPVPLCVGFGIASELIIKNMEQNLKKTKFAHDYIYDNVVSKMEKININGSLKNKVPHIMNLNIPFVEGESLLMKLKDFALASGSACTSKSLESSHVIKAMHPEEADLAHSSLRICFGQYTKQEEVEALVNALKKYVIELRNLSPLWDMYKKGVDLKNIKWNVN